MYILDRAETWRSAALIAYDNAADDRPLNTPFL